MKNGRRIRGKRRVGSGHENDTICLATNYFPTGDCFSHRRTACASPQDRIPIYPPLSTITHRSEAFRRGLSELGYIEGETIAVEWRSSEGSQQRLRAFVAELLRLKVDVIVSGGSAVTRVVKEATSTIPIIMAQDSDPVGNGFVASLARPGGNITGLSTLTPEIRGKQLELLMEIVPGISRVVVFNTSTQPGNTQAVKEVELAAGASGVKLQFLDVIDATKIDNAFHAAANGRADAVLMMVSGAG